MQNDIELKNMDFEISFYEKIISFSPNFTEALIALGDLYTKKGLYLKGLTIDQKLASLCPDDPIVLYNLGCSYSLLNEVDKALLVIKEAIKIGYDDFEFLSKDEDLGNLQKDERFVQYFLSLKKKRTVKQKKT